MPEIAISPQTLGCSGPAQLSQPGTLHHVIPWWLSCPIDPHMAPGQTGFVTVADLARPTCPCCSRKKQPMAPGVTGPQACAARDGRSG